MKKYTLVLLILFLLSSRLIGQTQTLLDSIIIHQKSFEIKAMEERVKELPTYILQQLFAYEIAYQKTGKIVPIKTPDLRHLASREKLIAKYLLNNLQRRADNDNNSTYLNNLTDTYKEIKNAGDTIIINEILQRINNLLLINGKNLGVYEKYINTYAQHQLDSVDNFNITLHRIFLLELQNEKSPLDLNTEISKKIDSLFLHLKAVSISPYFLGYAQSMQSNFESAFKQNQTLAITLNHKARKNYNHYPYHFAQYGIQSINFNTAIIYYETAQFKKAIVTFNTVLDQEKNPVYKMHGLDWLHKCYDSIGDYGNAYKTFKKMGAVKDSLNLLKHAKDIEAIESLYNFEEKEAALANMAKNNRELVNRQHILIPILFGVTVLAGLGFFFYRKYRTKSDFLEGEQSETLKRLEEIKKIIIKNHVILKDKRKVYVADLMYIKSEDHYLNLFLNDGNNYFVRGKLKDIKEELPPNFIQCHRSYIVNRNFVQQQMSNAFVLLNKVRVPISRGYKENT